MSDQTLIALSREVVALTQARDRLQQQVSDLEHHNFTLQFDKKDAQRQASLLLDQSSQRGDKIKILTAQVQALEAAASHLHPVAGLLVRVNQCCDLGCPDIDLEQDGDLDLSWFKPDATISASLSVKGRVAWAAHLPALKSHGQFHLPELADDFKTALTAYAQLPDAPAGCVLARHSPDRRRQAGDAMTHEEANAERRIIRQLLADVDAFLSEDMVNTYMRDFGAGDEVTLIIARLRIAGKFPVLKAGAAL